MSRIYVASSWRNTYQPGVVEALRADGHEVYDFRHPAPGNDGFSWREISPGWEDWTRVTYVAALEHPIARRGFGLDYNAMRRAEQFCLVLPCGRSAHLEAGWATGAGKPTSIYIPERIEPELMYLLAGLPCTSLDEVRAFHADPTRNIAELIRHGALEELCDQVQAGAAVEAGRAATAKASK